MGTDPELDPSERRIAGLIAAGVHWRQIAGVLGVAPGEAQHAIRKVYARVGARSVAEVTSFAVRKRIVVLSGMIHLDVETYWVGPAKSSTTSGAEVFVRP